MGSEVRTVMDHFKINPLVHPVPADRLIVPDPSRQYFLKDDGNQLTWSGLDLVYSMNERGLSTKGLFCKENTVVLPHKMAFGFKEVNLDDARPLEMTERVDNFIEYTQFLVGRIKELHGDHVVSTLPPVFKGLETMALDLLQNDQLLDLLLYYPALLPIHSKALLYRRIYNLLIKRVPLLYKRRLPIIGFVPNAKKKANTPEELCARLLAAVPYSKGDPRLPPWASVIVDRNPDVFKCFLTQKKMAGDHPRNLVALLRNAPSHPLEEEMAQFISYLELIKQGKPLPPNTVLDKNTIKSAASSTLSTVPPSCAEVIHLMDDSFPEYLPDTAKAFWTYGVYSWLDVRSLFPGHCC